MALWRTDDADIWLPKRYSNLSIAFTRYEHFKLVFVAVIVLQPAS